jgi:hypothetical protein
MLVNNKKTAFNSFKFGRLTILENKDYNRIILIKITIKYRYIGGCSSIGVKSNSPDCLYSIADYPLWYIGRSGMRYPIIFPTNCPPDDAKDAEGIVYRVVRKSPPKKLSHKDYISYRESQPNRIWDDGGCECCRCAVSVITEYEEIPILLDLLFGFIPGKRTSSVTRGCLNPNLGVMRHSPRDGMDSHHDWWVPEGVDPSSVFEYIELPVGEKT